MRTRKKLIEKNIYFHPDTDTYSVIIRKKKRSIQKRFKTIEKARRWKKTIFDQIPSGIVQFSSVNGYTVWDIENQFLERHAVEREKPSSFAGKEEESEPEDYDAVFSAEVQVNNINF